MMYADAYPLAIPEWALHAAAKASRGACRRKAEAERRTCTRHLIAVTVCPCVTEDACLMDRLVDDLLDEIADHEAAAVDPSPDDCRLTVAGAESSPTTIEIAACLRASLCRVAGRDVPVSCVSLAAWLARYMPHANRRLYEALEFLMREDAEQGRPFIASLVIVPTRGGLPGPWFFDLAAQLGRFAGQADDLDAWAYHARELHRAAAYWRSPEVRP